MVHVNCDYTHQWLSQRCEYNEALVPFDTYGPGDGAWEYVALFMLPPAEAATDAEIRQETGRRPKHVDLVEFKLVSKPFGMIDWPTARVVDGHVLVRTRHWIAGDGHMYPRAASAALSSVKQSMIKVITLWRTRNGADRSPGRDGAHQPSGGQAVN